MRLIKGTSFTLHSPVFVTSDGETPTNCDATPTCAVTREDGTVLTAAVVSSGSDTGQYTAAITSSTHTTRCDILGITWTGDVGTFHQTYTDSVEVVGAHTLTIPEIRQYEDLSDTDLYPTADLMAYRDELEAYIDHVCKLSFVRRYYRDRLDGLNQGFMNLSRYYPRTLISVTINGTAVTDLSPFTLYDIGRVTYYGNSFASPQTTGRNVLIAYEYGMDVPPPMVKRELLKAIRATALAAKSSMSQQAIAVTFEGQTLRYSTPDMTKGRPTGILTLDPVLNQYAHPIAVL